jgi:hypothetical protein
VHLKCLLHLSASHLTLAADVPSEISLAIIEVEIYGRSATVSPPASQAMFTWLSALLFQGILECSQTR